MFAPTTGRFVVYTVLNGRAERNAAYDNRDDAVRQALLWMRAISRK